MGTPNREPQEYSRNIRTLVGIFLLYSHYILGVPCLGFPVKSLQYALLKAEREFENATYSVSSTVVSFGVRV